MADSHPGGAVDYPARFRFKNAGHRGSLSAFGPRDFPLPPPPVPAGRDGAPKSDADVASTEAPAGEQLTILLVEDERALREIVKRQLIHHGYRVITATNGLDAIDVASTLDTQVDLVITDVVMPKMKGNELATQLKAIYPDAKVLFMSGFTRSLLDSESTSALLEKPFTEAALLAHIHQALGNPPAATGGPSC